MQIIMLLIQGTPSSSQYLSNAMMMTYFNRESESIPADRDGVPRGDLLLHQQEGVLHRRR